MTSPCSLCGRSLRSPITKRLGRCQTCDQPGYRRLWRQTGNDIEKPLLKEILEEINQENLKQWLLNELQLIKVLEFCAGGGVYDNSTPIIQQVKAIALSHASEIQCRTGLCIKDTQSGVAVVNKLLRKVGSKAVIHSQPGPRGGARPCQFTIQNDE